MSQRKKKRRRRYRLRKEVKAFLLQAFMIAIGTFIVATIFFNMTPKHDYTVVLKDPVENLPTSYLNTQLLAGDMFKVYEDENYTSALGIDVSMHQKSIDWSKVKESGITFAYIRCGYRGYQGGKLNVDPTFKENIEGAIAAGLDVGVYFFSQAVTEEEAIDEAYFTADLIKKYDLNLPVVYDLEDIDYDISRIDKTSGEQRTLNAISFAAKMEELGYDTMIYANIYWLNSVYDLNKIMNYPLWIADYDNVPSFEYEFKIWQYSDEATIAGISEPVDINLMLVPKKNLEQE